MRSRAAEAVVSGGRCSQRSSLGSSASNMEADELLRRAAVPSRAGVTGEGSNAVGGS